MKKYTIGALFTPDFEQVLLILKKKPEWQRGKFNLPGGQWEEGESKAECVSREFEEETNLRIPADQWHYIGTIENHGEYLVEFFTTIHYEVLHGAVVSKTEERLEWHPVNALPKNVISNLHWLVPFARNFLRQGNADKLMFGHFSYKY